jgi:hypothetical protein
VQKKARAKGSSDRTAMSVAEAGEGRRGRSGPALVLHGTRRLVALCVLSGVGFVLAVGMLLAVVLSQGPLELPHWVAERVEAQINDGLPAGRVTLDRVELAMGPGGAPQVQLSNVGLFDGRGTEVARLNEVGAGFVLARLMRGNLVPEALALSGAQVTLRRRADGGLDLSFGQGVRASGSLASVLDGIDAVFADGPLAQVTRIGASELTITLEDARADRLWQVTDGRLYLTQDDEAVNIAVDFDVFNGTEDLASTAMTFRSDKASPSASVSVTIRNASSGDIALQSPVLAFLGVLDAPISGALEVELGKDAALETFSGNLEIGAGAVTPGHGWDPVEIESGRARFTYDPERRRIDFADLSVESEALAVALSGQAFLEDLRPDGWPTSFVGQFRLPRVQASAQDWLPAPIAFTDGLADLKLTLQPFRLTVGALTLHDGDTTLRASGAARSGPAGPDLSVDVSVDRIDRDRVVALWPERLLPRTRDWLVRNVLSGTITSLHAGLRREPGKPDRRLLGLSFANAAVRWLPTMPPIEAGSGFVTLDGARLTVTAEGGHIRAREGGDVDIAGSVFLVPDVRVRPQPAEVQLAVAGPVTAALSILDEAPLNVMKRAGQPVDVADGQAVAQGTIAITLKENLPLEEIVYDIAGRIGEASSGKLVEGRLLSTSDMRVTATPAAVEIGGEALFGKLPVDVVWTQPLGPDAAKGGMVEGSVEISELFLREFGIDLPRGSVTGRGSGHIRIDLGSAAPHFTLTSDLVGLGLRVDGVGWRKAPSAKGRLMVEGVMGDRPRIDRIELEGGGLTAAGKIVLNGDGSLDEARLTRVRLGGWLDAPVTLYGRGQGAQPGVRVSGGTLDFRKANFGDSEGPGGGPVTVALDRLHVADGITLTGFRGDFSTVGGFGGRFTARLNGGGEVNGTVVPQAGGSALRVTSDDAGDVLRDADLAQRIRGGAMVLTLVPTGQTGVYSGSLTAQRVRVRGTPALAALLDAISVVGLLTQLNGDGIVFDDVQASFTLTPNAVNFRRSSAVGASMGISLEGMYELGTGRLDMKGVFSPVYLLNGIGSLLTRRGEGLFGFNFSVAGTAEDPKVRVNPLSVLTPGMFRELFRGPPPQIR